MQAKTKTRKVVPVEMRGTYSIYYLHEGEGSQFALDWDFGRRGEWSATEKEYGSARWCNHHETDKKMREVLLAHFGLTDWKDEYPIGKIKSMSPRELASERRQKEKKLGLSRNNMQSDTVGFHIDAEDYSE